MKKIKSALLIVVSFYLAGCVTTTCKDNPDLICFKMLSYKPTPTVRSQAPVLPPQLPPELLPTQQPTIIYVIPATITPTPTSTKK